MGGTSKLGLNRIKKEYIAIQKDDTITNLIIEPNPKDFYEWHFVIYDLKDCPYEGGYYHGKLILPPEYPVKPPGIMMLTPNGRFKTNTRICLSMSDFHPETWSPSWSISKVLIGLVSFMTTEELTTGCERKSDEERRKLAAQSLAYNMNTAMFVRLFKDHFDKIQVSTEKIKRSEKEKEIFEEEKKVEERKHGFGLAAVIIIVLAILVYKKFF